MKTHYSVIFASINSIITERLSVGLILTNGKQNWFAYSSAKLSLEMKHFFNDESYQLLKTSLRNIEYTFKKLKTIHAVDEENVFFEEPASYKSTVSAEFLDYLNRYSNANLTFSAPVEIDAPASDELFLHLFSEMVFAEEKN
ncbi:MAG: hypothetical protein K9H26_10475 [Prolixibacteraceae bacterium]|nr:hypothetical protein [Prolixibacteraceae bacterium]